METEKDAIFAAVGMNCKAAVLAARRASTRRRRALEKIATRIADDKGQLPRREGRAGFAPAPAPGDGSQSLPRGVTNVLPAFELAVLSRAAAALQPPCMVAP